MPLYRKKNARPPIGLTVQDGAIRLVQAQPAGVVGFQIIASATPISGDLGDSDGGLKDQPIVRAIQTAYAKEPFVGKCVVSCLRQSHIELVRLRLSGTLGEDLDQVIQNRVAEELSLPIDTIKTAYYEIGQTQRGRESHVEVIAVAAQIEELNAYCKLIRDAGLKLTAVDTSHAALARCLNTALRPSLTASPIVVLHIQGPCISIVKIHNGKPCFARQICPSHPRRNKAQASACHQAGGSPGEVDNPLQSVDSFEQSDYNAIAIAREIEHILHYLQSLDPATSSSICVITNGSEQVVVGSLNEVSSLNYIGLSDALSDTFLSSIKLVGVDTDPVPWLTELGLSMYGWEQMIAKEAA